MSDGETEMRSDNLRPTDVTCDQTAIEDAGMRPVTVWLIIAAFLLAALDHGGAWAFLALAAYLES